MILNQPVKTAKGVLLIEKGQEITFSHLLRLINFSKFEEIPEPISVLVPSSLRARMAHQPASLTQHRLLANAVSRPDSEPPA